jgi:hypothetical protein
MPLPEDLTVDVSPIPDRFARCLNAEAVLTVCSRTHAWRATGLANLTSPRAPSEQQARKLAIRRCPVYVTSRTFRYRAPSGIEFRAGAHYLVCYSKTRH